MSAHRPLFYCESTFFQESITDLAFRRIYTVTAKRENGPQRRRLALPETIRHAFGNDSVSTKGIVMRLQVFFGAIVIFGGMQPISCSAQSPAVEPPAAVETQTEARTELYVRTNPKGAAVSIDGQEVGTSNDIFSVSPGQHHVTLQLGDYRTHTSVIVASKDEITRLEVQLHRKTSDQTPSSEQDSRETGPWIDLLDSLNLSRDTVNGLWVTDGTSLSCNRRTPGEMFMRTMLPISVEGGYDMEVEFVRTEGVHTVAIQLPVADSGCIVHFSSHGGRYGGIEYIDGRRLPFNRTANRSPNPLVNGRTYRMLARVRINGDWASVEVILDDEPFVSWEGDSARLKISEGWTLPEWKRPALGTFQSSVKFSKARLRTVSGKAKPIKTGLVRTLFRTEGELVSMALSLDGWRVVVHGEHQVRVFNAENADELRRADKVAQYCASSVFVPGARSVFSSSRNGEVVRWEVDSFDKVDPVVRFPKGLQSLALSDDGRYLAVGDVQDTVHVWDLHRNEEVHAWRSFDGPAKSLAVSPLGRSVLAVDSAAGTLHLFEREEDRISQFKGVEEAVAVACSPDGSSAAVACGDGRILICDLASRKVVQEFKGHDKAARCVSFSASGRYLLSGGEDHTVRLWNVVAGKEAHVYEGHDGPVTAVGFARISMAQQRYAVSSSEDGTLRKWRLPVDNFGLGRSPQGNAPQAGVRPLRLEDNRWTELAGKMNLREDRVTGDWRCDGGELLGLAADYNKARIMLPVEVGGNYDLDIEFTRVAGNGPVVVVLPIADHTCRMVLSGEREKFHGISNVDDVPGERRNDASVVRPGKLTNGRPHVLSISVRQHDDMATLSAVLDDKPLVKWHGKQSSLGNSPYWLLPAPNRVAIGHKLSTVVFHSVRLRPVSEDGQSATGPTIGPHCQPK